MNGLSRAWMFNHSNFLVHPPDSLIKSYGIVDLDHLVNYLLNHPKGSALSLEELKEKLKDPNHELHHSLNPDLNDTGLNPYEEDAIHMAILTGKISKEDVMILNNPDLQNHPIIIDIRKRALGAGAKLVNEAAREQNRMNGMPLDKDLPFTKGGELNMDYRKAVSGKIYDQTKGNTEHFRPRNSQNKLVTRLISSNAYEQGTEEAYARWYGPAARKLGFLPTKKGKGKIDDLSIPAHYVHKNTINLNDKGLLSQVFNTIKGNANPAEAVQEVRNLKSMFHYMNPIHHSDNASMHEYNDRQAERQAMVDAGQGSPDGEMLVDGKEISVEGSPTRPNHEDIIHPKVYEEIPAFRLFMERGRGGGAYHYPSQKLKNSLKEHMGLDEETVERVFAASRKSNKKRVHNNAWHNVAHEISQAMQQKTPTEIPLEPTPETGMKEPVIQPQIKVSSNAPRITPKPDAERIVNVGNQPRINRLPAELVDQINRRKFELGINSNEPLSDTGYRDRRAAAMNPESLSRLFTSLTNGLNIEELEKSMFEDYLEGVQMRLAETVLADYTDIRKMDISSPTDITILSSRIQRSTNDVITIYHTRGDWRNIAKSFGLDPLDVQLVKVSLNG